MIPTSATPKGECYVTLPGIIEVYSDNSGVGTGIENNINTTAPTKFIESGQLFIQRNGQTYTILGTLK